MTDDVYYLTRLDDEMPLLAREEESQGRTFLRARFLEFDESGQLLAREERRQNTYPVETCGPDIQDCN